MQSIEKYEFSLAAFIRMKAGRYDIYWFLEVPKVLFGQRSTQTNPSLYAAI
ncbi:hypothetical protein NTGBS_950024 [Candidatus Nitrotoga sp. BS]|nr:hypothetical protein NTGBS_950024 [Candidatus Nitrotoga sp. BS]